MTWQEHTRRLLQTLQHIKSKCNSLRNYLFIFQFHKYLHTPNSFKQTMMMMIKRIRNGILGFGLPTRIQAQGSPNFSLKYVGKPVRLGSVSVYMSETCQVEDHDTVFPSFCPTRRNVMPKAAALLDLNQGNDAEASVFEDMKQRFLSFKKTTYMKELEHYKALARAQNPKFMVVACVDSRVCPSNILGFQPGEAFMVRNVANLVPHPKHGPSETIAALEFAVKTLQVEHIFVVGHSCCAGIETLMRMEDSADPSFTEKWVAKGKIAKLGSVSAAGHLTFERQCKHCEKESINHSMQNLMMYPWIEEKVKQERIFIHGGYYDFLSCTFEKWTLDLKHSYGLEGSSYLTKDRQFWS